MIAQSEPCWIGDLKHDDAVAAGKVIDWADRHWFGFDYWYADQPSLPKTGFGWLIAILAVCAWLAAGVLTLGVLIVLPAFWFLTRLHSHKTRVRLLTRKGGAVSCWVSKNATANTLQRRMDDGTLRLWALWTLPSSEFGPIEIGSAGAYMHSMSEEGGKRILDVFAQVNGHRYVFGRFAGMVHSVLEEFQFDVRRFIEQARKMHRQGQVDASSEGEGDSPRKGVFV